MANEFVLTKKGKAALEEELEYLKTVKRAEISEQIKVARSFGDLSENAEYTEARNEQSRICLLYTSFRDLHEARLAGNKKADTALKMFCYRVKKYIGSYAAAMGGVDVIAFAGGVGENDWDVREWCLDGLESVSYTHLALWSRRLPGRSRSPHP